LLLAAAGHLAPVAPATTTTAGLSESNMWILARAIDQTLAKTWSSPKHLQRWVMPVVKVCDLDFGCARHQLPFATPRFQLV
jgi:hypothetical protein